MIEMKEYAEALYSLACEENMKEEISLAVREIDKIFKETPEYLEFLSSPAIEMSERLKKLDEAFGGAVPEYMLSFLKLLCEKRYIKNYSECAERFNKLVEFSQKISVAKVKSAVPLTEEEMEALTKKLEKLCGHRVRLDLSVEKEILGGFVVEVDDRIIDARVHSRLREVKEVIGK